MKRSRGSGSTESPPKRSYISRLADRLPWTWLVTPMKPKSPKSICELVQDTEKETKEQRSTAESPSKIEAASVKTKPASNRNGAASKPKKKLTKEIEIIELSDDSDEILQPKTPVATNMDKNPFLQYSAYRTNDSSKTSETSSVQLLGIRQKKRKQNGFHSTRTQQIRNQSIATSSIKKNYKSGFKKASEKGFRSSDKDYENLVEYMKQVTQKTMDEVEETPSKMRKSSPPKTLQASKDPLGQKEPMGSEWLTDLRKKIEEALNIKPKEELIIPTNDTAFNKLLEQDREIDAQIDKLREAAKPKKNLFPPLTEDQLALVKKKMFGREVVSSKYAISIKPSDLQTLNGSSWLNDEVINFYGEMIMERAKNEPDNYPKIHVFNTFFYEKLKSGYQGVRRWSKKFDVFSKDYIIIPVHMGMHWCCSVIDFKRKQFLYYDSLHGSNNKCLSLLRNYLEEESLDKRKIVYDTSDWTSINKKDCPAQENGYDCGVFTCMFMDFTAREEEFVFRQQHMPYIRKRMALEIINMKLMA